MSRARSLKDGSEYVFDDAPRQELPPVLPLNVSFDLIQTRLNVPVGRVRVVQPVPHPLTPKDTKTR
jgi:hypothetical protein